MTQHISALLIDDDKRLAALLTEYLERNDVRLRVAHSGTVGLAALAKEPVDLVILDLMLPDIDGLEVCRRLRAQPEHGQLPVLMLTARGEPVDRVVGLELGADDYVGKPFEPRELLARIRALVRRTQGVQRSAVRFRTGGLEIDFDAREVWSDGERRLLTHFEFELLSALARSAGRVLSREQLFDRVKGETYDTFDRAIDVHISRLRAKLELDPKDPRYIKTVRGVGYVLVRQD